MTKRLNAIAPESANGELRSIFEAIEEDLGMIPNSMRIMANSLAVLKAYRCMDIALERESNLSAKLRSRLALFVSELNRCRYCLTVFSAIGRIAGLSDEEIRDSRGGNSPERMTAEALGFARQIVERRGQVDPDRIERLRDAGFSDAEIIEMVATISQTIFTNYMNTVAGTEIDYPEEVVTSTVPEETHPHIDPIDP